MKQPIRLSIFIFMIFHLSSCYRMAFSSMGVLDKSIALEKISNSKREVVFIPMHHIGKREFYDDVKKMADSLHKLGYVFYYEGVKLKTEKDSLKNDSLRRKMRHVVGSDVFSLKVQGGYIDTVNQSIFHKKLKIIMKEKLVNQPPYILMSIDTAKSQWADVYLSEMITAFEKRFGNIVLEDCDYTIALSAKYSSCSKYKNKKEKDFLLIDYRNESIAKMVLNDTNNKIAIIYGSKHYGGILKILQQQDSAWKTY